MAIRGWVLTFPFFRYNFIHYSVKIRAKNLFKIGNNVKIESNAYIDAFSEQGVIIGNNVSIGKNTRIECSGSLFNPGIGIHIGNGTSLGTDGFFGCAGGIIIGDDTIMGNWVSFHAENHNFNRLDVLIKNQGVNRCGIKIGNNCWIGAKVTILDGVIVQDGCVIAAGSVVSRGIYEPNSIIGGVPARVLKKR
ncbi:Acetyltransferase (isoleucine patch superfamily) [Saccharicrinis carchari]|uniref:Acetyltransferase (Isoleucine patch superfamily) n=1 Tax=Saccharicrinis carchari TaxID=1168039 RepID=A0A521EVC3_SACCC|nr:acyltransferase [Saccharicrinis carchari]SMO87877.1 Acetyltransferase (isoleucine patch superfamily) [Saccharicrinis carchari]